jgi:hypothetical protein
MKLLVDKHVQCTAGGRETGGPDYFCRVKEPDRPDPAGQGQVKILITEKEPPAVQVRPDDEVSVVHVGEEKQKKIRYLIPIPGSYYKIGYGLLKGGGKGVNVIPVTNCMDQGNSSSINRDRGM